MPGPTGRVIRSPVTACYGAKDLCQDPVQHQVYYEFLQ